MGETLLLVVPAAIAVALSPIGLVEMILVLFSERARTNGIVLLGTVFAGALALPMVGAFAVHGHGGDE